MTNFANTISNKLSDRLRFFACNLLLAGIFSFLCGCGDRVTSLQEGAEIFSTSTNDGGFRSFIWKPESGGATVSQSYEVWVEGAQFETNRKELMLSADKTDGIKITWLSNSSLEICYSQAQINRFRNTFLNYNNDSRGAFEIEITLKKVSSLTECEQ